jgi:MoxR-like ATPase
MHGAAAGEFASAGAAAGPAVARAAVPPVELRGSAADFVDPTAIRAVAESSGLRLPVAVYANVSAALAAGKHVLLTGAPGAGKTSLALAIARAAAQAGRAHGATIVTARRRWDDEELLVDSAKRGRWVIVDELDRARLDRALGQLSSFLAGLPVLLPSGEEAVPEAGWRILATAARVPRASAALLRRFAIVEVPPPAGHELVEALNAAARADATAAAAIARLLPLAEVAPLGAGVFIDAARHAAARNAAAPADEATLAREAYAAYIAHLLGDVDDAAARRVREIVGDG